MTNSSERAGADAVFAAMHAMNEIIRCYKTNAGRQDEKLADIPALAHSAISAIASVSEELERLNKLAMGLGHEVVILAEDLETRAPAADVALSAVREKIDDQRRRYSNVTLTFPEIDRLLSTVYPESSRLPRADGGPDIVAKLRNVLASDYMRDIAHDAADEIERLEGLVQELEDNDEADRVKALRLSYEATIAALSARAPAADAVREALEGIATDARIGMRNAPNKALFKSIAEKAEATLANAAALSTPPDACGDANSEMPGKSPLDHGDGPKLPLGAADSPAGGHAPAARGLDSESRAVELLRMFLEAFDKNAVELNSEEIEGDADAGIPPHCWHDEWLHHARSLAADGGVQSGDTGTVRSPSLSAGEEGK